MSIEPVGPPKDKKIVLTPEGRVVDRREKPRPAKVVPIRGSWKTNIAGALTALGAGCTLAVQLLQGDHVDWELLPVVIGGVGLLFARDNAVPDEEAGAK